MTKKNIKYKHRKTHVKVNKKKEHKKITHKIKNKRTKKQRVMRGGTITSGEQDSEKNDSLFSSLLRSISGSPSPKSAPASASASASASVPAFVPASESASASASEPPVSINSSLIQNTQPNTIERSEIINNPIQSSINQNEYLNVIPIESSNPLDINSIRSIAPKRDPNTEIEIPFSNSNLPIIASNTDEYNIPFSQNVDTQALLTKSANKLAEYKEADGKLDEILKNACNIRIQQIKEARQHLDRIEGIITTNCPDFFT